MQLYNPIKPIAGAFIARLKDEYTAHYFYKNAANYFDNIGYTKLAAYCNAESESELTHAGKIMSFLNDWGLSYKIPTLSDFPTVTGIVDFIEKAYTIETDLYKAYQNDVNAAETVDRSAYVLNLEMLGIQREAVAEYRTLLDQLALIDVSDKLSLFIFEKETF